MLICSQKRPYRLLVIVVLYRQYHVSRTALVDGMAKCRIRGVKTRGNTSYSSALGIHATVWGCQAILHSSKPNIKDSCLFCSFSYMVAYLFNSVAYEDPNPDLFLFSPPYREYNDVIVDRINQILHSL
jgi:hypothetical protein